MRLTSVIVILIIGHFLASCASREQHWGYTGDHDPSHWSDLSDSAKVCEMGHHQSPIDIQSKKAQMLRQELKIQYHKAPLKVVNNGHTVEFDTLDSHYIYLNKKRYELVQFHFHAHSEHAVDGKFYPAEMHLVHQATDGETVVLAVFQDVVAVAANNHIFDQIPAIGEKASVHLDLEALLPKNRQRFVYDGSLTTPPCTENVTWLVFKNPVTLAKQEFERFKMYYSHNFRPIQQEFLRGIYQTKNEESL